MRALHATSTLLGHKSIRLKLIILTMIVCGITTLILSGAFVINDIYSIKDRLLNEISLAGQIVGQRSASRIAFQQSDKASQDLQALDFKPSIMLTCLYGNDQSLFSHYISKNINTFDDKPRCPNIVIPGHKFVDNHLQITMPIIKEDLFGNKKKYGFIYIESDLRDIDARMERTGLIILMVVLCVILIGYMLAISLQSIISKPILSLLQTTRHVAEKKQYSTRATKYYNDEVGELTDSFNDMMKQLQDVNNNLECKVKERTAELETAKTKAESANKAKSEFLRNMSHEFRTPLHAMNSFSIYGIKESETAERSELHKYFDRILNGTNRLLKLVDGLLSLAKLESGQEAFSFEQNDLISTCETVIAEEQSLLKDKQLTLDIVKPSFDTRFNYDNDKLIQVVTNIVGNAIKFTPVGKKITLSFKQTTIEASNTPAIALAIADQGIGIPDDEIETIFDKFAQSSRTNTGAGGTGLGLAIAVNITKAHDGNITVHNNDGGGTTFIVTLPTTLPAGRRIVTMCDEEEKMF